MILLIRCKVRARSGWLGRPISKYLGVQFMKPVPLYAALATLMANAAVAYNTLGGLPHSGTLIIFDDVPPKTIRAAARNIAC